MDRDAVVELLDRQMEDRHQRTRAFLIEMGELGALAEYDHSIKQLRLGVTGAKSAWHSISDAQRRLLLTMSERGVTLLQLTASANRYHVGQGELVSIKTVRALAARGLLDWNGGAFNPEGAAVLSERGRFVLRHGYA